MTDVTDGTTVDVGALDDLDDGSGTRVVIDGRAVSLVRLGERVYAIGDTCSHAEVSLSDGEVDEDECTIECPKHGSEFDLRTGEALTLPAVAPVPAFEARVEGGRVLVDVTSRSEASDGSASVESVEDEK